MYTNAYFKLCVNDIAWSYIDDLVLGFVEFSIFDGFLIQ